MKVMIENDLVEYIKQLKEIIEVDGTKVVFGGDIEVDGGIQTNDDELTNGTDTVSIADLAALLE